MSVAPQMSTMRHGLRRLRALWRAWEPLRARHRRPQRLLIIKHKVYHTEGGSPARRMFDGRQPIETAHWLAGTVGPAPPDEPSASTGASKIGRAVAQVRELVGRWFITRPPEPL